MQAFQNRVAVVTGGCGFIGSHLVRRLRQAGARVLVIDSLAYGRKENLDLSDSGIQIKNLELRSGTVDQLRTLVSGADWLFHLAAEKHNQSINSPTRVLDANITGTYELLRAAADVGVKKVVFTSSLYAYGRMTGPPMAEDEVPAPTTIYGVSKLAGEHICRHFAMQQNLPAVCLRLFFVYGPRQYAGLGYKSVIVKNFERMLRGEKPVINGDGMQELDYIYVDDVVSALLVGTAFDEQFAVFNVGNGSPVNVNDLTGLMINIAGARIDRETAPCDFTHGSSRVANTGKFEEYFGVQVRVPLAEGLRRTFEWIRSSQG